MKRAQTQLISISGASLSSQPISVELEGIWGSSKLLTELVDLLAEKNGFYAFESALHVLPLTGDVGVMNLSTWNRQDLWRKYYGGLADGCLFFAEDVFGFQFAIKDDAIYSFNSETAELEVIAADFEEWAAAILGDYHYLTGYPFARDWQLRNRPLMPNERLFPKYPFVLGGKYEVSNLYASDAVYGMQFRGYLAQQIKDLPDGAQVNLVFDPIS